MSRARRSTTIDHVLKYTGVFGGVQGLSILISVVRNKLTTSLLGPAGIGLMGIYLAISEFVSSTCNFGLPFSFVRRLSELFEADDTEGIERFVLVLRTWCVLTALLAGLVCVVCAPLLGSLFSDGTTDLSWHPALVAPMAMSVILVGGEISILKGIRRLKRVAWVSMLSAVSLLCFATPIFWLFGIDGILLALDITAVASLAIHLAFTLPIFPWRIAPFSREVLQDGMPMLRIGIPFVLSAMAGSGTTMALSALLLKLGSMEDVGLYRSASILMMGYAGIVFSALESDFFPRLSSVNHDRQRRNRCINQQIQVCVALVGPFMIGLAVLMPVVLHILYASEFLVIEEMALAAVFFTFFRAITTPIGYSALAHGDSLLYLTMEVIYDIVMLLLIVSFYHFWGLLGAGIGLSASALFDLMLISTCYGIHYGFRFERHTIAIIVSQTFTVAAAVAVCFLLPPIPKYIAGALLLALSTFFAVRSLGPDSEILQKFMSRFRFLGQKTNH